MSADARDTMDPNNGWVVIAAYKMEWVMRNVVKQVLDAGYPLVVVDNGSPDATFDEARRGGAMALRRNVHGDPDAALQTGVDYAMRHGAPYVYTFVLDGEQRPESPESPLRSGTERSPICA